MKNEKTYKKFLKEELESRLYDSKVVFGGNDIVIIDTCCNNVNFVLTTRFTEDHVSLLHVHEISGFLSSRKLKEMEIAFDNLNNAIDNGGF